MSFTQVDDYELLYMSNTQLPLIGLVNSGNWFAQLVFYPNGAVLPPTNKPRRLGVRCKERLIRQPGGELIDIERLVEAGAQLLRIDEQADLGGLASEHPAETWV
jgi:hypothetical protein